MPLVSSVPKLQFTPTGLVVPAESDILAGTLADLDAAFGGGMNLSLETPQGQLASTHAAVIGDKNNEIALLVNQVDPQYAADRFQDAIARIYFLTRKPATPTLVAATLTGVVGAVVPAGTLAKDTSGNTYLLSADATIGGAGTIAAQFANLTSGPIPCPAGTLTQVYQAVAGWDAITNAADGVPGTDVETREAFEFRRKNSVAINASGSAAAIYAEVFDVDNVVDVYVAENPTAGAVATGASAYSIIAHSVFVAVLGGVDADVAAAIWRKKNLGCNYNGNTTVAVVDSSGYSYPEPSYSVKFHRPAALPIKFAVSIADDPALPANTVDLIKAAIIAKFTGTDGTERERIGASVFTSRYYGPVAAVHPKVAILSLLIGTVTATLTKVDAGIDQYPTITGADIVVTLV